MRNTSGKVAQKNQNTYFLFSNYSPKVVPFLR